MNFEHFGPARDLLYLTALLTGICIGAFLIMIQKANSTRSRSRWVSVLYCLVSLTVASLAGAVILSRGQVFTIISLYPFVALFLILGILGARFPRAGGCTIIFVIGLAAVWICFSFLVYPSFEDPAEVSLYAPGAGQFLLRRSRRPGVSAEDETWNIKDDGSPLLFEAASLTAYPGYPIIGGERRGIIVRAGRQSEQIFSVRRFRSGAFAGPGFILDRYSLEIPSGALLPGMNLSVLFNGEKLYVDPAIQL
jgi:hypothetical protein